MAESISFDRAAEIYDATRALDGGVAGRITEALRAEIEAANADRVLEVGIGTGRMARPLLRAGLRIVGVDISAPMMARLREQLTPDPHAAGPAARRCHGAAAGRRVVSGGAGGACPPPRLVR